ncbi:alpha/beta fold hydrolase [Amycolatopsis orientalis]|uniref:alpha/beta fold hydrolase n=1 Tax=Amycolatopsis orientalis TaxID=31958 RepID=UPI00039F8359|nr:alpha/beta fold hydrolase [Amycolatopsis orientalis]
MTAIIEPAFERVPGPEGAPFTFVLVHGWARSRSDWRPVLPGLRRIAPVVLVDLRGHGESRPGPGMRLPDVAADVRALVHRLGLGRVVLVAHSAGSEVAAFLARREPESVAALVAIDPAFGLPDEDRARIEGIAERLRREDPAAVAREHFADHGPSPLLPDTGDLVAAAPAAVRDLFIDFAFGPGALHFQSQAKEFFAGFAVPLLAIYRNDERARLARDLLPAATITVLPGGHWTHHEHPGDVVAAIAEFLSCPEEKEAPHA